MTPAGVKVEAEKPSASSGRTQLRSSARFSS